MSSEQGTRPKRVAERIRAELMEMLLRGAIKDPQAASVVISDVTVTRDLGIARVYLRLLSADVDARAQKNAVKAMERAGGFMRRELGPRLGLRHVPELHFHWDDTAERSARIETLLDEVRNERKEPEGEK